MLVYQRVLTGFDFEHTIMFVIFLSFRVVSLLGNHFTYLRNGIVYNSGARQTTPHNKKHDKHMTTNHKPKSQETSHITNEVRCFDISKFGWPGTLLATWWEMLLLSLFVKNMSWDRPQRLPSFFVLLLLSRYGFKNGSPSCFYGECTSRTLPKFSVWRSIVCNK